MAAKTATCQYRTLTPLERDVCRVLAQHELTGWAVLREYVDVRVDPDGIETQYILTQPARRELQRRWCWEGRQMLGGGDDGD